MKNRTVVDTGIEIVVKDGLVDDDWPNIISREMMKAIKTTKIGRVICDGEYTALGLCEAACREFIRKVDCGEACSRRSYEEMKAAIALLDRARKE